MALVPISTPTNCRQRGGISEMYVTACANVQALTFDADNQITAIQMDAGQADPTFKRIQFQKNTGSFEQVKTVPGGVNVAQTINFIFEGLDKDVLAGLYQLNQECCVHAIVVDNQGNLWYFGVSYYPATARWDSEDLSTGDGNANSGDDPTSTQGQIVEALTCNAAWYAPRFTLGTAGIPTA